MAKKWKLLFLIPLFSLTVSAPILLTSCTDPALFDIDQRNNTDDSTSDSSSSSSGSGSSSSGGSFSGNADESPY